MSSACLNSRPGVSQKQCQTGLSHVSSIITIRYSKADIPESRKRLESKCSIIGKTSPETLTKPSPARPGRGLGEVRVVAGDFLSKAEERLHITAPVRKHLTM